MKLLFSILLVFNLFVEMLAAVATIGGPVGISAAGSGEQWSMHYGFAALAIASLSVWAWPYRSELKPVTVTLGLLMTFHVGLLCSLLIAGDQQVGVVLHSILATLSIGMFSLRRRWCDSAEE